MKITTVEHGVVESDAGRLRGKVFSHIMSHHLDAPPGSRVVDLGAGHCLFARRAAGAGFAVTAVDGRVARKPDDLGSIEFVQSDLRDFDLTGFRVVLILGVLYHLTLEDQVALLARCPLDSEVVVDTQIHDEGLIVPGSGVNRGEFQDRLVEAGGHVGVLYPEVENPMASIGNAESFWHTEPSLLKLFADAGFGEAILVGPPYISRYGGRRWYVLKNRRAPARG